MKINSSGPRQSGANMVISKYIQLANDEFHYSNSAKYNSVFLWRNTTTPPFMAPVNGWEIVGYGTAPWPSAAGTFAVMFERVLPSMNFGGNFNGDEFDIGERIWQHGNEAWIPGSPAHAHKMNIV